jgi:hypothetical protein
MLRAIPDGVSYLAVFRKSTDGALRKHQAAVDDNFENAVRASDQTGRGSEFAVQFCRQPGGPWLVVSDDAIFDRDVHRASTLPHGILADLTRARLRLRIRARDQVKSEK